MNLKQPKTIVFDWLVGGYVPPQRQISKTDVGFDIAPLVYLMEAIGVS